MPVTYTFSALSLASQDPEINHSNSTFHITNTWYIFDTDPNHPPFQVFDSIVIPTLAIIGFQGNFLSFFSPISSHSIDTASMYSFLYIT